VSALQQIVTDNTQIDSFTHRFNLLPPAPAVDRALAFDFVSLAADGDCGHS
jgi:hypothetical protein